MGSSFSTSKSIETGAHIHSEQAKSRSERPSAAIENEEPREAARQNTISPTTTNAEELAISSHIPTPTSPGEQSLDGSRKRPLDEASPIDNPSDAHKRYKPEECTEDHDQEVIKRKLASIWAPFSVWFKHVVDGTHIDQRQTVFDKFIVQAAKVTYFRYNELNSSHIAAILNVFGGEQDIGEFNYAAYHKKLARCQSTWQGRILTVYIYPHVERLVKIWVEEHPNGNFEDLSEDARENIWMEEFDKDAAGIAQAMWKSVADIINFHVIYGIPLDAMDDDTRAKIEKVRAVLFTKYMYACEECYHYRIYLEEHAFDDMDNVKTSKEIKKEMFENWRTVTSSFPVVSLNWDEIPLIPGGLLTKRKQDNKAQARLEEDLRDGSSFMDRVRRNQSSE